jgi:hypothetical protein
MVGHDGEGEDTPGTPKRGSTEMFLKPISVDVIAHNVLPAVSAGHKVVDSVGVLEA